MFGQIPGFDPVQFLVERKFGASPFRRKYGGSLPSGAQPITVSVQRLARFNPPLMAEIENYKADLKALDPAELSKLVEQEKLAALQEQRVLDESREKALFFNNARADFEHWSKAAHWTLDEAIALSLGKAPEVVQWEKVKEHTQTSPFAQDYARRRDLAIRACYWKQLFDPVLPGIFLAWAKRTDLGVPQELETAVAARGIQIADWKSLFDDLQRNFDENHAQWMALCDDKSEYIKRLEDEIAELNRYKQSLDNNADQQGDTLSSRERESLLKLVIGMAVGGYGFDPRATRSTQTTQIADDLARVGVPLDVDTVRKWVREATSLLPPLTE